MANPNPRSGSSQLYADAGLIDGLPAPKGGLGAFVGRRLLPPPGGLLGRIRAGRHRWPRGWARGVPAARRGVGRGVLSRDGGGVRGAGPAGFQRDAEPHCGSDGVGSSCHRVPAVSGASCQCPGPTEITEDYGTSQESVRFDNFL
jgi:hypothetical protein